MAEPEDTRASSPPPPSSPPQTASEKQEAPKTAVTEMLDAMSRHSAELRDRNPALADHISSLRSEASDSIRANQRELHHLVAYAAQDAEKTLGHQLPLSDNARTEMQRLAGSAPGLENPRMLALMQSTAGIASPDVVRDIRNDAAELGRQANQNNPAVDLQLDQLENRVRQATRSVPLGAAAQTASTAESTQAASARTTSETPANPETPAAAAASRAEAAERKRPELPQPPPQPGAPSGQGDPVVFQRGALDSILDVMKAGVSAVTRPAPWEAQPQPFGDRLSAYQSRTQAARDDAGLHSAERAGRAAVEALESFRQGDGATIMNRIQSAARSDPDGIAGVLSGMRDGGRYQDLRQQFNNAMHDEAGFARAYDKAAESLAKYGEARTGVEEIIARRPDAANLTNKFQQMDAEIGDKVGSTPSRQDGKGMIDDISKRAAEIIQHAVEALRSIFSRSAPQASQSGPSPS